MSHLSYIYIYIYISYMCIMGNAVIDSHNFTCMIHQHKIACYFVILIIANEMDCKIKHGQFDKGPLFNFKAWQPNARALWQ